MCVCVWGGGGGGWGVRGVLRGGGVIENSGLGSVCVCVRDGWMWGAVMECFDLDGKTLREREREREGWGWGGGHIEG